MRFNFLTKFFENFLESMVDWDNDLFVESDGTMCLWGGQVDEEESFEEPVEWKPTPDGFGKEVNQTVSGITTPVDKPFGVIFLVCGVDGLD